MSALEEVSARWSACRACRLRDGCRRVVFGEAWSAGDPAGAPLLLVVGEAPGKLEDESGRPFVGDSGKLLREEVLLPADVRLAFVTNAAACRPPGNRPPEPDELEACAPRLAETAAALRPDGVLFVGRTAEEALAGASWLVGIPAVGIVHPSALLREGHPTAGTRKKLAAQLAKVRRLLVRAAAREALAEPREALPAAGAECAHDYRPAGAWEGREGAPEPFSACLRCSALLPA